LNSFHFFVIFYSSQKRLSYIDNISFQTLFLYTNSEPNILRLWYYSIWMLAKVYLNFSSYLWIPWNSSKFHLLSFHIWLRSFLQRTAMHYHYHIDGCDHSFPMVSASFIQTAWSFLTNHFIFGSTSLDFNRKRVVFLGTLIQYSKVLSFGTTNGIFRTVT
jgi:hypothetical protein